MESSPLRQPSEQDENWTEFEWELELRKDDARVSAYIEDLPKFIDLPDEDGIIMRRMKKRPELTPSNGDWENLGPVPYSDDDDGDWSNAADDAPGSSSQDDDRREDSDDWQNADGGKVYHSCSLLARDWVVFSSCRTTPELREPIMAVTCRYGKILARSADLVEMSLESLAPDDDSLPAVPNLRIAVCKRLLGELNKLLCELDSLAARNADFIPCVNAHRESILGLHGYLVDVLAKLRALPPEDSAEKPPRGDDDDDPPF